MTRPGEAIERTTLGALDPERVTMRTLVVVAGDTAAEAGPWLVACAERRRRRSLGRPARRGARMTVTFVGAGPGDPELLTVAARRALEDAEVVVYDRPSADAVVALAPAGAERVCVGLAPGRRALSQDDGQRACWWTTAGPAATSCG